MKHLSIILLLAATNISAGQSINDPFSLIRFAKDTAGFDRKLYIAEVVKVNLNRNSPCSDHAWHFKFNPEILSESPALVIIKEEEDLSGKCLLKASYEEVEDPFMVDEEVEFENQVSIEYEQAIKHVSKKYRIEDIKFQAGSIYEAYSVLYLTIYKAQKRSKFKTYCYKISPI